jgi:hypothetical protein
MENAVQEIRSVAGVTGVMILDRRAHRVVKQLPSLVELEDVISLETKLVDLAGYVDGDARITIRFSSGLLIIRSNDLFVVQVTTRGDVKLDTLNIVLKSALSTLTLSKGPQPEFEPSGAFDRHSTQSLLDAINSVARYFIPSVGAFSCANALRKAKEQLAPSFPVLKHFPVDNNGVVSLIRGYERSVDNTALDAVANWCHSIKELINANTPVVGFDIRAVTDDFRQQLAPLGFYSAYQRAASKTTSVQS